MAVPRGTTPTFTLKFTETDLDLTQAYNVYVTFKVTRPIERTITKTGEALTVSEKQIGVFLTQAETLVFPVGPVKIQANWTTEEGKRVASTVVTYPLSEQLLERVVE